MSTAGFGAARTKAILGETPALAGWRLWVALFMFVLMALVSFAGFYDRSVSYVPVEAMTRSIRHECIGVRTSLKNKRERRQNDDIKGMTCEALRTRIALDSAPYQYEVQDWIHASVVYRSPVDKQLYIGELELGLVEYIPPVDVGSKIQILASLEDIAKIQICCEGRVDWTPKT